MHDAKVLNTVRKLRNNSKTSLEAGAVILSCDYFFYRFDCNNAKKSGTYNSVILPNLFWQIIRPYLPSSLDFDKIFAETFALPEFRALGGGGKVAASKMLSILASYKNVPETTASKMLTNSSLIEQLQNTKNDSEFEKLVENELIEQNLFLTEENAALENKLEQERKDKEKISDQFSEKIHSTEKELEKITGERDALRSSLDSTKSDLEELKKAVSANSDRIQTYQDRAQKAEDSKKSVENKYQTSELEKNILSKSSLRYKLLATVLSVILFLLADLFLATSLQISQQFLSENKLFNLGIIIAGLQLIIGFFFKSMRKVLWYGGFGAAAFVFVLYGYLLVSK